MDHVAIDLGKRESQICVRSSTRPVSPPSRVVLETCSEAFAVADQARAAGHEVRVVPATLVRSLGVGQRDDDRQQYPRLASGAPDPNDQGRAPEFGREWPNLLWRKSTVDSACLAAQPRSFTGS